MNCKGVKKNKGEGRGVMQKKDGLLSDENRNLQKFGKFCIKLVLFSDKQGELQNNSRL